MIGKPTIEDEEILRLYASGVRDFTRYIIWIVQIVNTSLSGVDFSGQDLSESYLEGIDLSGANLSGAMMNQTCLDGANLSGANLSGTGLAWATLWYADLTDANLTGACLREAEIVKSLTNAILFECDIEGTWLKENIYRNTTWIDGTIRNE